MSEMPVSIREAAEADIEPIREIFIASYGDDYTYPQYYDPENLKRLIYDRDVVFLVAEDPESGRVFGTASVILDIGAFGDLIGEFGRLAVHPDSRGRNVGNLLMEDRIERVRDRLHIGVVENRAVHPFSQKISARHGFVPVGFLPSKMQMADREHVALYARHFGEALALRRNHPRIIPEAWSLADQVLGACGIRSDVIVDCETAAYPGPGAGEFDLEEMTSEGYSSLLHFERGRVRQREILGPVKLNAGFFLLRVSRYQYIMAHRGGHLAGGIGYHIDRHEGAARILELVSADATPIRRLLEEVTGRFAGDPEVHYVEIDVNAHATAMQRTLLELGYLPAAYIPAMSFHRVERLDAIRMVRLFDPLDVEEIRFAEQTGPVADLVIDHFREKEVDPRIAGAVPDASLFAGLNPEQAGILAAAAELSDYPPGEFLIREGENDGRAFLILSGEVGVRVDGKPDLVARLGAGDMLGELSLLEDSRHHATGESLSRVEAVAFLREDVEKLTRQRPDIGVILFRNLAGQLGGKLLRGNRKQT